MAKKHLDLQWLDDIYEDSNKGNSEAKSNRPASDDFGIYICAMVRKYKLPLIGLGTLAPASAQDFVVANLFGRIVYHLTHGLTVWAGFDIRQIAKSQKHEFAYPMLYMDIIDYSMETVLDLSPVHRSSICEVSELAYFLLAICHARMPMYSLYRYHPLDQPVTLVKEAVIANLKHLVENDDLRERVKPSCLTASHPSVKFRLFVRALIAEPSDFEKYPWGPMRFELF